MRNRHPAACNSGRRSPSSCGRCPCDVVREGDFEQSLIDLRMPFHFLQGHSTNTRKLQQQSRKFQVKKQTNLLEECCTRFITKLNRALQVLHCTVLYSVPPFNTASNEPTRVWLRSSELASLVAMPIAGSFDPWLPTRSMLGQPEHEPNLASDGAAADGAIADAPLLPIFTLFSMHSGDCQFAPDPVFVPRPAGPGGLRPVRLGYGVVPHALHSPPTSHNAEAESDNQADALAAWVASIIASYGGVITSASLGSTLSSEHQSLYRVIKVRI